MDSGRGRRPTHEMWGWFDSLEPVTVPEMVGRWVGEEIPTGHRLGELLSRSGWQGKDVRAADDVDPLVFPDGRGGTVALDPRWVPLTVAPWLPRPLVSLGGRLVPRLAPVVAARQPQARLVRLEHRDVVTAAMVYDRIPVVDVFRRVDAGMVLGVMEMRGEEPFFFRLSRRREPPRPGRCPRAR